MSQTKPIYYNRYLELFKNHLASQKFSTQSTANYLSDISQFLNWQWQESHDLLSSPSSLEEKYKEKLNTIYSTAAAKRKLSSVKKFLNFINTTNQTNTIVAPSPKKPNIKSNKIKFLYPMALVLFAVSLIPLSQINAPDTSKDINITSALTPQEVLALESSPSAENLLKNSQLTTGRNQIATGTNETIITDISITKVSNIFITPTCSTPNPLFVKKQENGYFVVGTENEVSNDVCFNWLVIN
jgi:hypothetical protein